MSGTLGVGVRVFVGFCEARAVVSMPDPRFQTATIISGPFSELEVIACNPGLGLPSPGVYWGISLDSGGTACVHESMLVPIDDDDGLEQPRETELPAEHA